MKEKFSEHYRKLGLNINFYRRDKGMKQAMLAELIGLKEPSHLSKIENGCSAPSLDVLFGIAEALDISVEDLFKFK